MYPDKVIKKAQDLFEVEGVTPQEIGRVLGVRRTTIYSWIARFGWVRREEEAELIILQEIKRMSELEFGIKLKGTDVIILETSKGRVPLNFLTPSIIYSQGFTGNLYIDEAAWLRNFEEVMKVAKPIASQDRYRTTYLTTASSMGHPVDNGVFVHQAGHDPKRGEHYLCCQPDSRNRTRPWRSSKRSGSFNNRWRPTRKSWTRFRIFTVSYHPKW